MTISIPFYGYDLSVYFIDVLLQVIKAFSILTNTENLFGGNVGGGSLACFHGIRFLSATWIILGHTYFYTDTWKYLKYREYFSFYNVQEHGEIHYSTLICLQIHRQFVMGVCECTMDCVLKFNSLII